MPCLVPGAAVPLHPEKVKMGYAPVAAESKGKWDYVASLGAREKNKIQVVN